MSEFKRYRRKEFAELRPVGADETVASLVSAKISINAQDVQAGSPKEGDMIARNPQNHKDQWLVAAQYFKDNFEQADR
jgi:hypothetical protein